jgi:uncharacterized membrane protein
MKNLIVVGFTGMHRASEVLAKLQKLNDDWTIDLDDAVAAYRTEDGRLRVDQSVEPTTKQGAGWGALLGGMLGAIAAAPFTGGLSVAAAAAAVGAGAVSVGTVGAALGADDAGSWKQTYGVSDEFVADVGGMIEPGDSAVFALIRTTYPELVAQKFRGYGGNILRTTLPTEQAERVQSIIRS